MPRCLILVDNSNVFIEGSKYSARAKGILRSAADNRDPLDPSWRCDFGQLANVLADGREIIEAVLVGSTPPQSDGVWSAAKHKGFRVLTHERGRDGEKAVDTEIVAQGAEIICDQKEPGVLVLASGDRDFIPLVKLAQRRGWQVEMCAFTSAFSAAGEMAQSVNKVRPLDADFEKIGRYDFKWPSA